ncbi:MAG: hypothetical protein FJW37_13725 [Acidobacteria bacterium]|nr:hypothetical protein [Acidobacteriota bacterium]
MIQAGAAKAIAPSSLDRIGRWFLEQIDYQAYGLLMLGGLALLFLCRRLRDGTWPAVEDCLALVVNCLAAATGVMVGIVFLLTRPPAVEVLPNHSILIIGLYVPIVTLGHALPRLRVLFFPRGSETGPKAASSKSTLA